MAQGEKMMSLTLTTDPLPLRTDEHGNIRVGNSRVTFDLVVTAFCAGLSAEEIVQRFPTLNLADVYMALGFYLRHQAEVDVYLDEQHQKADAVRQEIEAGRDLN